ncbi:unnamed protein product [Heterobilharzia americana]|nr:unnamed protein product [Heterobilharzia americana]
MTELYHHHQHQQQNEYAYQQPQLPPIPHPQSSSSSDLPPPYPAPITTCGASLKRGPPTDGGGDSCSSVGSLQDGYGYGMLRQRGGPLTASVMTGPSPGGGDSVPMSDVYYRGSRQALLVNAAGPWAAHVAELAEIGSEHFPVGLPVEPRYRQIFVIRPKSTLNSQENNHSLPGLNTPFIIDHNRLFIERRDLSGEFIVYSDNPKFDSLMEKKHNNLNSNSPVDYGFFYEHIEPLLCKRIPGFKDAEVISGWTSVCDYNTWDQI